MAIDRDTSESGGNESELKDLFAQASDKARAKGASEESLDELEAFLDAFEKDPEAASANLLTSRTEAPETAPAVAASSAPVADFSAPEHVEALVHGLLKDDDFDLAAAGNPRASTPEAPGLSITPAAPAATTRPEASGAQPTAPLTVAAVAMSTVALLIAIGAGWASFGAREEPAAVVADPALGAEVSALKQRLAAVAAHLEGPVGDITDSYPRDMDALGKRIDELHAALVAVEQRLAAVPAAPTQVSKAATRNEPPTPPPAKPARESWQVNLVSFTERAGAEAELKRARAQGMNAEIVPAERDGRTWYRVAVVGFASAEAARAYVVENAKKAGYPAAWIARP